MVSETIHAKVAAVLRRRIVDGDLAVGDPMPSEAALVAEFGASRGTVRQALATLRTEGLIGGGQGRPPVVRQATPGQPFETFLSFTAWAEESGRKPGQRTVEIARRAASTHAADALGLAPGDPVIEVLRLRFLDDEPAMLERSTFVEHVGRLLFDMDPDAGSLYAHLTACGVDLHDAQHTIDAIGADETDAELLAVEPGSPLLRERREVTSRTGEPLEYADDRYRPDRATFTIRNSRNGSGVVRDLHTPAP